MRFVPYVAVAVAIVIAGVTTYAMGGTERAPTEAPPIQTPRLKALWEKGAAGPTTSAANDEDAPEDETPTLSVLTAGGLPEEPNRHDLEAAIDKVRKRVEECGTLEQFVGMVQVRLAIDRSGNVKSAHAVAPLDETQTGQCVAKEVRHASFPRFRGTLTPTIELLYPFYFRPSDN